MEHSSKLGTLLSENSVKSLHAEKKLSEVELKLHQVESEKSLVEAQLDAGQKKFDTSFESQRKEFEIRLDKQQKDFAAEKQDLKSQLENAASVYDKKLSDIQTKLSERDTSIIDYKTKLEALQAKLDSATGSVTELTKNLVDANSSSTSKIELLESQFKEVEKTAAADKAALDCELVKAKEAHTALEFALKEQALRHESAARETAVQLQKLESELKLFDYFDRDLKGYEAQRATATDQITKLREQEIAVQARVTALESTLTTRVEGLRALEVRVDAFERRLAQSLLDKSKSIIGTTTLSILNTGNSTKTPSANSGGGGGSPDSRIPDDGNVFDVKKTPRRNVSLFAKNMNIIPNERDEDCIVTGAVAVAAAAAAAGNASDMGSVEESELEEKENGLAGSAANALLNIKKRAGNKRSVSLVVR